MKFGIRFKLLSVTAIILLIILFLVGGCVDVANLLSPDRVGIGWHWGEVDNAGRINRDNLSETRGDYDGHSAWLEWDIPPIPDEKAHSHMVRSRLGSDRPWH